MDFHLFDSFLDPVIVINIEGDIRYINPVTTRWLTLLDDFGIVGNSISRFVSFSECPALNNIVTLVENQNTGYYLTHFQLLTREYHATAKICVVRLKDENQIALYGIIIRDRAFIKTLLDEDDFKLKSLTENSSNFIKVQTPQGMIENTNTEQVVLRKDTLNKNIDADRKASFDSVVNLVIMEIGKAVVGHSTLISDDWIEIRIKPIVGAIEKMKVNLEIAGNVKMRGFSCVGELVITRTSNEGEQILRIKLGSISALARRALDEYLEINSLKL